jgi:hypothetical protein
MANDSEFLAFVDRVLGDVSQMAFHAHKAGNADLAQIAFALLDDAGKKKRQLLGLPEPDPDVDYDPDYHWDGTPLLPGETRQEKGGAPEDGYDLKAFRLTDGPHTEEGQSPSC